MSRTPPPALEVEEVSHFYGARKALDRVSLHVEAGRFTALLGPNGAGKSTLFSLITRLFAARHGSIRILGTPIDRDPGAGSLLLNILWFVLAGWWLALQHILLAAGLAVTIIGIPFAWQHVKLAILSLTPVGKDVVEV